MLPRERKTANCFEALEATHSRCVPGRQPVAGPHQPHPERMTLTCQAIATPHDCCHRACKQPKPARSKAMPVTKDSLDNDRCSLRARHSQLNTTTSPASKLPAAPSLRLFSADSCCREIQPRSRNLHPNVSGAITAKPLPSDHRRIYGLTLRGKVVCPFPFGP